MNFRNKNEILPWDFLLMVGYAATLGGLATIIGTPPNVVFAGLLDEFYHQKLDFGKWMLVGVPVASLLLVSTHLIITRILFPNNLSKVEGADALIKTKLGEIGKISNEEKLVLIIFGLTSFFWIFQQAWNTYIFKQGPIERHKHCDDRRAFDVCYARWYSQDTIPVNVEGYRTFAVGNSFFVWRRSLSR
jgi:di/tricarboxylate transporter